MPDQLARRHIVTELGGMHDGPGLEIGPLAAPIALKSFCDVRYVDVLETDRLREHYRDDPSVDLDLIPELDFWLQSADGTFRSLQDAVRGSAPYRWVIASHVVEHVPDLIGWLADIAAVLEDWSPLILAVPDQRYSFDVLRTPTTVGQILQAHLSADRVPSVRAVYDHFSGAVLAPADRVWSGWLPTSSDAVHYHSQQEAYEKALEASRGDYVDAHVWTFEPDTFADQIAELGRLELVDFYVDEIIDTARDELEFYVRLVRLPRRGDPDLIERQRQHTPSRPAPVVVEEPAGTPTLLSDHERRLIDAKRRVLGVLRGQLRP
jgi:hypothetical protein